jgi:hypothetical protein
MDNMTRDELVVIVSCVFLGWLVSVYIIEGRFRLGSLAVYGKRRWRMLTRLGIWFCAIGFTAISMIAVSNLAPGVTVLAILFGIQAMLFDFCSRIRFLDHTSSDRSSSRIAVRGPRHS